MDDVNLQLVREFFELNVFRVLTNWQQDPLHARVAENSGQLFIENAVRGQERELPFVLSPTDIACIGRAVVEIRAWHADRFYPSVIEANPVLSQFVADDALALAREVFADEPFETILVLSELPVSWEQRNRSIELLRAAGIRHVLEFPVILQGLLSKVSVNGNYTASQTLQTLRLLKRYKLVRNQQMEFSFTTEAPVPSPPPQVEAVDAPPAEDDEE
ncbi:MAG: hypothetical protein GY851_11115 [bacterium]|nr:hypothetical protein [bacterium]